MHTVMSRDGTRIAYDKSGKGPLLIMVDGALCYRAFGPAKTMSEALAPYFTVITYDRRGRGDSADTTPHRVHQEVEDLAAIIGANGGAASLCGFSSGAALALEAANAGLPVTGLVLYEAPFIVDAARTPIPADFIARLDAMLAAGDRGGAVAHFMRLVGMPGLMVYAMKLMPAWKKLKMVAHTLPYDIALVAPYQQGKPLPAHQWGKVTAPTLVLGGGKSPAWMLNGVRALAEAVPGAKVRILPGQTHMVKASAIVPALREFLGQGAA